MAADAGFDQRSIARLLFDTWGYSTLVIFLVGFWFVRRVKFLFVDIV
jgi:hypothetical protein